MNKKVSFIIIISLLIGIIVTLVGYGVQKTTFWVVLNLMFVGCTMLFVCFSTIITYARKKQWLGFYIAIGLSVLMAVFGVLEVPIIIKLENVQKEIEIILEEPTETTEEWELRQDKLSPLRKERNDLNSKAILYRIVFLFTIVLLRVPEIVYDIKKTDEKDDDTTHSGQSENKTNHVAK